MDDNPPDPHFSVDDHAILWARIVALERKLAVVDDRTKLLWRVILIILGAILGLYLRGA